MEAEARGARPGLTDLEERLLAASVHGKLFARKVAAVMLGRYRVLERLGQGGMGVVFRAHDEQLDRMVAIKLLHAGGGGVEAQARLRREALALGRLSHPNVVAIYEIGEAEGQLFVAMELIEGVTLQAWLGQRRRSVAEIVEVYVQAGRGLAAAHAVGLVHRDFKPDNVLVGVDGRVRVVDFGLARQALDGPTSGISPPGLGGLDSGLTATGALLGTPAYMAPEQIGSHASVDARSDQFSFCVSLYESLYGERPFGGETFEAYVAAVEARAVRPPTASRRVARRIRRALLRGLEPRGDARWPDMASLLTAVSRRSRLRIVAIMLLLLAVALALAWVVVARARAAEHAEREANALARVEAIAAELAPMLDAGDVDAAERRIADVVAAPEIRDTEAAAILWMRWAELLAERDRPAQAAWANTYARTRDASRRERAALGLARALSGQRQATGVANALALLADTSATAMQTPEVVGMRFEIAAHHRDLATALELVDDDGADALAVAPMLAALARGRPQPALDDPHRAIHDPPALALPRMLPHPIVLPDGERVALFRDGPDRGHGDFRLHAPDGTELARWSHDGTAMAVLGTDLDDDGAPEVLIGFGGGDATRALVRLERAANGSWQLGPDELTDPISDIASLAQGDLDGDGKPELIVGLASWRAYDVRVFKPDAAGTLVEVARRKVGIPVAVEVLPTPHGPRLAVAIDQRERSPMTMPPARLLGVPAGVHLFRLDGDTLVLERSIPISGGLDQPTLRSLVIGDLDGDGLDDLMIGLHRLPRRADGDRRERAMVVARQLADGSFATVQIGGLEPLGFDQLDADDAEELFVLVDDERWVVGIDDGSSQVMPPSTFEVTTGVARAQQLARGGASSEVRALARVGLPELALSALLDGAASAEPASRRRLHFVGAALATELGEVDTARRLLADAADGPEHRGEALWQLARDREQRGDLTGALELLDRLLALPVSEIPNHAEATEVRSRLAALQQGTVTVPLLFSRGSDRPWTTLDPSQVQADPLTGSLRLETASELPAAVAWPLRWDGQQLLIELELRVEALEWGSTVQLRLVDDAGRIACRIGLGVQGGGGVHEQMLVSQWTNTDHQAWWTGSIPSDGLPRRLLLRIDGTTARFRYLDEARQIALGPEHVMNAPHVAGDYTLELIADADWGVPQARARVQIDRIAIAGAQLRPGSPAAGLDRAAALLVDGETHDAAAVLEPLATSDPRARLWLAVVRAELGDSDRAESLLRSALDEAPVLTAALVPWLRTRTATVAPLVRRTLGLGRQLELVERAWQTAISTVLDPGAARALRSALGGIEDACDDARCVAMRLAIGRAHLAASDPVRARRAFTQALASEPSPAQATQIALELTALEASAGDSAAALGHARRALSTARAPELMRDMLRARVELQGMLGEPQWRSLLAVDDGLP